MKTRRVTYGLGGFDPAEPNGNVVSDTSEIAAGLGADRPTIPANGTTFATLNYAGPEPTPHLWTVNGAVTSVPATRDTPSGLMMSEVEVTAVQAGLIEVSVNGATMQIDAV